MVKAARTQSSKNEVKDSCDGCTHYSAEVTKAHLPVMRNKVFWKVSMKCHADEGLKVLNEKYEESYPSEERLKKISPKSCNNRKVG